MKSHKLTALSGTGGKIHLASFKEKCWLSAKEDTCSAGDTGSTPGLGRSPGEGNGNLLQCSCLERIPWTEEPGGLQSTGKQRTGHKLETKHQHQHQSFTRRYPQFNWFFFSWKLNSVNITLSLLALWLEPNRSHLAIPHNLEWHLFLKPKR